MGSERTVPGRVALAVSDDPDLPYSTLREKLIVAQKTSKFDSMQLYVPADRLSDILSKSVVESELQRHGLGMIEALPNFILIEAKRIFAILVYLRLTKKIRDFFKHGFNDEQLPIEFNIGAENLFETPVSVFSSWNRAEILEFCDSQWRFNAPIFGYSFLDESQYHRRFPPQTVFPFDVVDKPKGTPFSKVWKIRIPRGHLSGDLKLRNVCLTFLSIHVSQRKSNFSGRRIRPWR